MDNKAWHFNGNGYGEEKGLDTPDMETFKKDPMASLAREICQNSIDAKYEDKKVKVEFHSFTIRKNEIPERERVVDEMKSCMEYKKNNLKIQDSLHNMLKEIDRDEILCLRISDFNTTGLIGVNTNSGAFYSLTKGSGLSEKIGTSGGSKGIGKFASFVASKFNTVFYATKTIENEEGYIGICKLCSTIMPNTDERTQGIGYYGVDKKNNPILEKFNLDKDFSRNTPGTDVYILGFRNEKDWKKEIITKILDSFMVAIYRESLEVIVDDIKVSKEELKNLIDSKEYILEKQYGNIKSQFLLLTEPTCSEVFSIEDYGNIEIRLRSYKKEEASLATNDCVMVRYPYMKIKNIKSIANVPCAAMCIIENNELNEIFREIENPQHTDWEIKRIDDLVRRAEVKCIYESLVTTITDYVMKHLQSNKNNEVNLEGAEKFLSVDDKSDENIGDESIVITEKPIVIKKLKNVIKDKNPIIESEEENANQLVVGTYTSGIDTSSPGGKGKGKGGEKHPGKDPRGVGQGDTTEMLQSKNLSGMHYRFFVANRNLGACVLSFQSLYDAKECELVINYLDDSGTRYPVNVESCTINGEKISIEENKVKNFNLTNGEKYKFELITDLKELYACEVRIYAKR